MTAVCDPTGADRPCPAAIRRALAELLTLEGVATEMGWAVSTAAKMRQRREPVGLPEPDARVGRTPVWFRSTIELWRKQRPGRGAGGGRPKGYRPKPSADAR